MSCCWRRMQVQCLVVSSSAGAKGVATLLSSGAVKKLLSLLYDTDINLSIAAAGALR